LALLSITLFATLLVLIKALDTPFHDHEIGKDHVGFEFQDVISRVGILSPWLVKVSHDVYQGITGTCLTPEALITMPIWNV
jgi:hypothetical protein